MRQDDSMPSDLSLEVIGRLIEFNTVSSNTNLELIEWVEKYLEGHGIASRLSYDHNGRKANLFATIGEGKAGGIILSGHTDTVPVTGQHWGTPPFRPAVADGKLFGRGAADMKAFIGVCLALVPQIQAMGAARPIHLALTFDEETTMLGVRTLIADLRDAGVKPFACIVGEPTELKAVVGHKGRRWMRCCVRGKSAHSSLPSQGVNAIEYATKVIAHLRSMAERHRQYEQRHYGYDVPYSTILTTTIEGGLSANTVPAECAFDFEFRHLPWTDPAGLESEIKAFARAQVNDDMARQLGECEVTFETHCSLPAFGVASAAQEAVGPELSQLLGMLGRAEAPLSYVGFGTEASWFQDAGIPTIVCGPGSIEQAHKPDEYIALSQIAECERLLLQLVRSSG
jgi:acetylornithine deacetylase